LDSKIEPCFVTLLWLLTQEMNVKKRNFRVGKNALALSTLAVLTK